MHLPVLFIGREPTRDLQMTAVIKKESAHAHSNNIVLMRSCVHFREKWQLGFQRRRRETQFVLYGPKKIAKYKKAMEISLNVFVNI